jgi:aminoglycoside phosphotransferase (APT) family kinase protein
MNAQLDAEILAALDELGHRIRGWQRISTIRAVETGRSVFRLDLESGEILKARRLEDARIARELFELRRELPQGFAPALHCRGRVLLEAWIDGEVLSTSQPTAAQLREAGALLASLHTVRSALGVSLPAPRSTVIERQAADESARQLRAGERLSASEIDRIGAALARLDPQRALAGLVHTDFCGENMVIDAAGRLRVIDNERMGVGPLGLDFARTWYRWMLPPPAWEAFRASYRACMPHDEPLRDFAFWALVATLNSAALFSRIDSARAELPIECLRRIMAQLEHKPEGIAAGGRSHR